jgi:hypothetical protein
MIRAAKRRYPIPSIDRPSVITRHAAVDSSVVDDRQGSTLKVVRGAPVTTKRIQLEMTKHEGEKHENLDGAHLT